MVNESTNACEQDISFLLWKIFKRLGRGKQRFLEGYGLTVSQMEIMGALYHFHETNPGDEITQISLSKQTFIDPMTTSTIIRKLEKKELLSRGQSKNDSRAVCVNLSEKGKQLFQTVLKDVLEFKKSIYVGLDKELITAQLMILLENIKINNC